MKWGLFSWSKHVGYTGLNYQPGNMRKHAMVCIHDTAIFCPHPHKNPFVQLSQQTSKLRYYQLYNI